jgi:hypothetical protein
MKRLAGMAEAKIIRACDDARCQIGLPLVDPRDFSTLAANWFCSVECNWAAALMQRAGE